MHHQPATTTTATTTTTTEEPPGEAVRPVVGDPVTDDDLLVFRLMHRGMRVDSRGLVEALLRTAPGDGRAARRLDTWFRRFCAVIVRHHTVEDTVFWPGLLALAPGFVEDEAVLLEDHHELDRAMAAVGDALRTMAEPTARPAEKAAALAAARRFAATIEEHLDREEASALELVRHCVPRDRWEALDADARSSTDARLMSFVGPWLDDHATAEEVALLRPTVPWPVWALIRGPWRRRYRRGAAPVRLARGAHPAADPPPRGRSLTTVTSVALLVGVAAALVGLAACGSDGPSAVAGAADGAHVHGPTGTATVDDGTVVVTMHEYGFSPIDDPVPAGAVRIRAVNEGAETHAVQIARPLAGVTAESFLATFREQGETAALAQVEMVGGVHGVDPGQTVEGVTVLDPGEYLLLCFFPTPDGRSHVVAGMVDAFQVIRDGERPDAPAAHATIHATDFSLAVPDGFDGQGVVELRNDGAVDHEVVFLRVADGSTPADVFAWYGGDRSTPPPFRFTGGVAAVQAGGTASVDLDLGPGTYMAVCFIPMPDGTPHALLGMVSTFTIS